MTLAEAGANAFTRAFALSRSRALRTCRVRSLGRTLPQAVVETIHVPARSCLASVARGLRTVFGGHVHASLREAAGQ